MITRETDYAIRTLMALAQREAGSRSVSMAILAEQMEIPYRFLRKLAKKMVAAGLIESRRGKGGGLSLARPPKSVSLYDAVAAIAPGSATISACLLDRKRCTRTPFCRAHEEFRVIQDDVNRRLKQITLDSLA